MNKAWQAAALTVATLLAWLRVLARDGTVARAEPKTQRPDPACRCPADTRRPTARLRVEATWPWAADIVTVWDRVSILPHPPD